MDKSGSDFEADVEVPVPCKKIRITTCSQSQADLEQSSSSASGENLSQAGDALVSQNAGSDSNDYDTPEAEPPHNVFRSINRRSEGAMTWIQSLIMQGVDPHSVLKELLPHIDHIPSDINPITLWKAIIDILSEPDRRKKIPHVNLLSDVVTLIKKSRKILVLTGAGVSVSCGIPDFRSRDGIYARLAVDFPDLPDPQAMFDMSYFTQDPRPFFKFAKEIYPGQFQPSRSHKFISQLQKTGRLLRNYTQNIDTLEQVAGITNVVQCHGSFATASCLQCKYQVDSEAIRKDIFNQTVPHCPECSPEDKLAILKPDIVFFGENLSEAFYDQMSTDQHDADLLLVIGSSLKVRPVALIPTSLPEHVPQILINREPLPHMQFDVELLGNSDTIVGELSRRLGSEFSEISANCEPLEEITELPATNSDSNHSTPVKSGDTRLSEDGIETNCSESLQRINTDTTNKKCDFQVIPERTQPSEDTVAVCNGSMSSGSLQLNEQDSFVNDENSEKDVNANDKSDTSDPMEGTSAQPVYRKKGLPLWCSKWKMSISKRLPDGTFYYDGNYRYVFPGAEVAPHQLDDDSSSDESDDSSSVSSKSSQSSDNEDATVEFGQLADTQDPSSDSKDENASMLDENKNVEKDNQG